jgi:hypothetical protein
MYMPRQNILFWNRKYLWLYNIRFNIECSPLCLECNGPEQSDCISCDGDAKLELYKGIIFDQFRPMWMPNGLVYGWRFCLPRY